MEIRQLRADEFEERMALSQYAFQFQVPPEQMEFHRSRYNPDQVWGAFDDQGEMLSSLFIIPFETWIQGRKLAMGGLAGVATWPEARRLGCVNRLLTHSLETMRTNGQTISMLHPFEFYFYHKYGWEFTVERKQYTIETSRLPSRKETPGQVKRMPKPDIELLNHVYTAYASRYDGMLVRTSSWWEDKVLKKQGAFAVYYSEEGTPEGYVHYGVEDRKLTVHDWVSTTEVSRVALWTFIGNHDSMIKEVTLLAPIDDPLPFFLPNPRIKQEIIPYFMSRIVDAEAFTRLYAWNSGAQEESIVLSLSDAHAPWNNGTYRLVWNEVGEGRLERLEGAESEQAVSGGSAITCNIQALTAMLVGNRKPSLLYETGRINGPKRDVELLERRITGRTPFLMDFF